MEEKRTFLEKSLEHVNYWLQFAETKNGVLIAFIVAMLAVLHGGNFINNVWCTIIVSIIYSIALVVSISSFYPKYEKDVNVSSGAYLDNKDNMLFWRDIAKYTIKDYLNKINCIIAEQENYKPTLEEKMYAEEIIVNARIAREKYKIFEIALKLALIGTIFIPIFLIIVA